MQDILMGVPKIRPLVQNGESLSLKSFAVTLDHHEYKILPYFLPMRLTVKQFSEVFLRKVLYF